MSGYPVSQPQLCATGRFLQKIGCLPKKFGTNSTQVYYPITVRPIGNGSGYDYSNDIKYKPGRHFPSPQPDEPKQHRAPSVATYVDHRSTPVPKTPKKTPVAQTVPLSTLPLPEFNNLPACTPATTCANLSSDFLPNHPTVQTNHTPYVPPLSAVPRTPYQNTVPDSIIQNLGHIQPTQYTWYTPHGALTYTPGPASAFPLPNPLSPSSPRIANVDDGHDEPTGLGLGLIPSPVSSDTSDSSETSSVSAHRSGVTLHPMFASDCLLPNETPIEWNVSEPVSMVRHTVDDASFITINAEEPATNPPTTTLRIDLCFLGQPNVKWNWEPITIHKQRPIRIADIFHAIHDYFQIQLTHPEFDIIQSYGKHNARIVKNSWRERLNAQVCPHARSVVYDGGLRRVDCLGLSKIFAGLWVDGSQLKLGLRA